MDWTILLVAIPILFSIGFVVGAIYATLGRKE
jgi:hypothetical protein